MKKKYIVNGKVYEVPDNESAAFLKDFPDAKVQYDIEGKQYQIPYQEVDAFETDMGLKKKEITAQVGGTVSSPTANNTNSVSETPLSEENKEPIPIVTDYGNGEVVNPKDPFAMAKAASEFSKRTINTGVTGETSEVLPDEKSIKASQEINKDLEKQGFKADFAIAVNDLPEDVFNEVPKEELATLYKENPLKFKQLTNELKNRTAIRQGAYDDANETIPEGKDKEYLATQQAIIESNDYNINEIATPETMEDLRGMMAVKQENINRNIKDEDTKKKMQGRLRDTYASTINANSLNLREEYDNSDVKGIVDINQYAGLETLKIFDPAKYENYKRIIQQKITPLYSVEVNISPEERQRINTPDSAFAAKNKGTVSPLTISEQIGKETVLRELNAIGLGNAAEQLYSQRSDIIADQNKMVKESERKDITPEELGVLKFQFDESVKRINDIQAKIVGLEKSEKADDARYPQTAQLKFDAQVKEMVKDDGESVGTFMWNKFGHSMGSSVDAIENILVSNFGSKDDKAALSMKRMGEQQKFDAKTYLPENERRINSPVIMEFDDGLQKQIKKVLNGRSLGDLSSTERNQLIELVKNNQDKIKTITNPEAGESKNFLSKATVMTVVGFTSEIAGFMAKMALLRGAGVGSKLAEAEVLFTDGYNHSVQQKLAEGASMDEANSYGILHGAILSTMVKFGSKFEAVKKIMAGGKSPLSKQIAGMSEETWNAIYNKNKSFIQRAANSAKGVAGEQVKMIGTFAGIAPTADAIADNVFYNADNTVGQVASNVFEGSIDMAIGGLPLIGFGLAKGSMKTKATPLEKAALWNLGDQPTIGKLKIDEAVQKGDLTLEQGELNKKTIDNVSKLISKVPRKTDKGKLMTDEQRIDYLYNLTVKENATQEAKNLPPKQAEIADYKAMVAEYSNELILDPTPTDRLESRVKTLEKQIEQKDEDGKLILNDVELAKAKAQLEAVTNELETRKSFEKVEMKRKDLVPPPTETKNVEPNVVGDVVVVDKKLGDLEIKPSTDNIRDVAEANDLTVSKENKIVPIKDLDGGVDVRQPSERKRVDKLKEQISSDEGYISRIIIDGKGNVVEGQHRLEAMKELGYSEIPVTELKGVDDFVDTAKIDGILKDNGVPNSDHRYQMIQSISDIISKEGIDALKEYDAPKGFEKGWDAAVQSLSKEQPSLSNVVVDKNMVVGNDKISLGNETTLVKKSTTNSDRNDGSKIHDYDIVDKDGKSLGYIEITDKGDYLQIGNVELKKTGTGLGTSIYTELAKKSDKPIYSDPSQTDAAKALWNRLVENGVAEKFKETVNYTAKTGVTAKNKEGTGTEEKQIQRTRYRTIPKPQPSNVVEGKGSGVGDVEVKGGFTEGKDLNKIYAGLKAKYGDKKAATLYEAANRLVNPNTNTIVEIRGNGVVVKEGGKYILKPFGNTDANSKKWTLYKGLDVTEQFTPTQEGKVEQPIKPEIKNEEPEATKISNKEKGDSVIKPEAGEAAPTTAEGKEGGKKPPPIEPTVEPEIFVEDKSTILSHRGLQEVATEFGLTDVSSRETVSDLREFKAAEETIDGWVEKGTYSKNIEKMIDDVVKGEALNFQQRVILQQHIANQRGKTAEIRKSKGIESPEYNEALQELDRLKTAGQIARSTAGAALRVGEIRSNSKPTLEDWMVEKQESTNVFELTSEQKKEVEKDFNEYEQRATKAEEKLDQANAEISKLKAELELQTERNKRSALRKKSSENLAKERKDIVQSIKDKWRGVGKDNTLSSDIPYRKQLVAIAPDVLKLTRNLLETGTTKLEDIVDNIYEELKGIVRNPKDIHDIIAGEYTEKQKTLTELQVAYKDIKDEAKLVNELERLMANEPKEPKRKIERNKRINELRKQIKDFKKEQGKPPEEILRAVIASNQARKKKIEEDIKNKNYTTEKRVPFDENAALKKANPKLWKEAMDAVVAKDEARNKWELKKRVDELSKRSVARKTLDFFSRAIATTKAIKAGIDDSVTMVQLGMAVMANPKSGLNAKIKAIRDIDNKTYKRNLAALHQSKYWNTIEKSGLDITEPKSHLKENVEELYDNNLLNQDIRIGKNISVNPWTNTGGIFERLFTSMGNNMRLNLFMKRIEALENEKKTFDTHPEEYKAAARIINELTGRGKVHSALEGNAMEAITPIIWAPKMLSSSLNLLGLGDAFNAATGKKGLYASLTPKQRKYALGQMGKGIGMGVSIMGALAMNGWSVDSDPESDTFGFVKKGTKSYNVFGRYAGTVKTIVQLATGRKKTNDKVKDLDERDGRGSVFGKFFRGKMTPAAGLAYDLWLNGQKNSFTKEPILFETVHNDLLTPISIADLKKGMEQDGTISLLTRFLPAFEGLQVRDDRDFIDQDIKLPEWKFLYDNGLKLVRHKKDTLKPLNKKGEEVKITDEKYKEFTEKREKIVKDEVTLAMKNGLIEWDEGKTAKMEKLTPEEKESWMMRITKRATKEAIIQAWGEQPEMPDKKTWETAQ